MATPLIPFTLAWLVGIWHASRIALLTLALGVVTGVAVSDNHQSDPARMDMSSYRLATCQLTVAWASHFAV